MIACLDFESVLVPEIWIAVAEKTGIEKLKLTTRDIADYNKLMEMRIYTLRENNLRLLDVQKVIGDMQPLEGAREFLDWLGEKARVVIVTDSFDEFVSPLVEKLGKPEVKANKLLVDDEGFISGFEMRDSQGKKGVISKVKEENKTTVAVGDSFNDVGMLKEADKGILYRPSWKTRDEFPEIAVAEDFEQAKAIIGKFNGN